MSSVCFRIVKGIGNVGKGVYFQCHREIHHSPGSCHPLFYDDNTIAIDPKLKASMEGPHLLGR